MISQEIEARILRLYHAERWKIGTIATQLGVHHTTVRRVLGRAGVPGALSLTRTSMIAPYLPLVREILEKYPDLRASRPMESAGAQRRPLRSAVTRFARFLAAANNRSYAPLSPPISERVCTGEAAPAG